MEASMFLNGALRTAHMHLDADSIWWGSFLDGKVRPSRRALHDFLPCIDYEWNVSSERSRCPELPQNANFNTDEGRDCKYKSPSERCEHSNHYYVLKQLAVIFIDTCSFLRRSCNGTRDFQQVPMARAWSQGAKVRSTDDRAQFAGALFEFETQSHVLAAKPRLREY